MSSKNSTLCGLLWSKALATVGVPPEKRGTVSQPLGVPHSDFKDTRTRSGLSWKLSVALTDNTALCNRLILFLMYSNIIVMSPERLSSSEYKFKKSDSQKSIGYAILPASSITGVDKETSRNLGLYLSHKVNFVLFS